MIALALLPTASAYQWDFAEAPLADEMTVHLCLGDFTAAQEDEIDEAMDAWQAGDGRGVRGARWTYTRGPDAADGTCEPGNGVNEIHAETEAWFADHDSAGALATTMNDDVSVSEEVDFVFNLDDGVWTARKPSKTPIDEDSMGMVALHELGHGLGFDHDDAVVAVMNGSYPNGGDMGRRYRPHADDYAGLADMRPDPSTGTNLMLGKFVVEPGDPGDSLEIWNVATPAWTVCREAVAGPDGPEAIVAAVHETDGPVTFDVTWNVSDDIHCFQGVEYEVGRSVIEAGRGSPILVQPQTWDFSAVPAGEWRLCAQIDADGVVDETHGNDNRVRSEALLTVQDCP